MKQSQPLEALEDHAEFQQRHIGLSDSDTQAMLSELGVDSMDELLDQVLPARIRVAPRNDVPPHTERETLAKLRQMAAKNRVFRSFIGTGYYNCHTPTVIQRNVLESPAWYTAYTPYQPEISQGRLEALLTFQTMVADLCGLEIANASLLDEATAAAEAMTLCHRVTRSKSQVFFVDRDAHPQTIAVVRTRAEPLGIDVVVGDPLVDLPGAECFAALFQYPGTHGDVRDFTATIQELHQSDALAVVAADLLSLTLLKSPGEMGADVAVGTTQRFGVPLFYGGPHAAYMATRSDYKRSMPGRLIGVSVDAHGEPAYRMALQTREQHIRRERATSNICTAQALLAIIAGFYAAWHGPDGLTRIAARVRRLTCLLADGLQRMGYDLVNDTWFDTLTVKTPAAADRIHAAAESQEINFRRLGPDSVGVSLDETTTRADVEAILACFATDVAAPALADLQPVGDVADGLARTSEFLTHPVFHKYRTETEMLRYLRRLADKDLALDRSMIPLGSCTMKLNATTEMLPVSWPEFADMHPHVPAEQAAGYAELIAGLEDMLCRATGYDVVSLQPNAGSQGEYAGLLAIRAYHNSRGEGHRNICLIPDSAHGTNPASASLAGLKIVVIRCDERGNIDLEDLQAKAEEHAGALACIMVTYPSTHGVFEEQISELCDIVHGFGGQVYIDGANLNAQVGLCEPGKYGGDVSHLNLHKTFCIPHGGGGPGVGPVAARQHLAEFLPGNPLAAQGHAVGPVAAAPWGSAGILPISWAYIYLMGDEGLRRASEAAVLSANYVAARLDPCFPVLYTGCRGRVAHECIVDVRQLRETAGILVDDVAKRLMDYGFHGPTMSFPVPGTLMIEPTESESRQELDRFCDAMIAIRDEIARIEGGEWSQEDNPLKHAPHTAHAVAADGWDHAYSREVAAFPVSGLRQQKYWCPVGRIDQVYGDRHLVCVCPPVSAWAEPAAASQ